MSNEQQYPQEPVTLPEDTPPAEWVDPHEVIEGLTEEEAEEGKRLGESIDTDDDRDSGL